MAAAAASSWPRPWLRLSPRTALTSRAGRQCVALLWAQVLVKRKLREGTVNTWFSSGNVTPRWNWRGPHVLLSEAPLQKPQDRRGVVTLSHWGRRGGGGRRRTQRSAEMVSMIRQLLCHRRPSFFSFPAVRVTYVTAALWRSTETRRCRSPAGRCQFRTTAAEEPEEGFTFRFPGKLLESALTFAIQRPNWRETGADKFVQSVSFVWGRSAPSEALRPQPGWRTNAWQLNETQASEYTTALKFLSNKSRFLPEISPKVQLGAFM